jgi:hypothetical protein
MAPRPHLDVGLCFNRVWLALVRSGPALSPTANIKRHGFQNPVTVTVTVTPRRPAREGVRVRARASARSAAGDETEGPTALEGDGGCHGVPQA